MKFTRILLALLIAVPFVYSCQADIEDTGDLRDPLVRLWRVTDDYDPVGANGYDVTIRKDATEQTRILFDNFGGWGTQDDLYGLVVSETSITIPSQTLDGTYTIQGSGTISSSKENITFTYSVDDTDTQKPTVNAYFGIPVVKKKKSKRVLQ